MRSTLRKLLAVVACIFVVVSLLLYNSLETRSIVQKRNYENEKSELDKLEKEIRLLENEVKDNGRVMNGMLQKLSDKRQELQNPEKVIPRSAQVDEEKANRREDAPEAGIGILHPPKKPEQIEKEARNAEEAAEMKAQEEQAIHGVIHPPAERHDEEQTQKAEADGKFAVVEKFMKRISSSPRPNDVCYAGLSMTRPEGDIQMLDMYSLLPFDDPDGGVWKQGFDITYSPGSVLREKRLEVIVVPHSHTDPGWISTFEDYYKKQTRNILNNMLKYLQEMQEMRFVYAEMSFFELWWAELGESEREIVKQLLKSRKLEILSGGWVMPDEANSHYYAVISQLMEGHEWIRNHIGEDYKPTNHWSIDPFGQSPTVSYFMKKSNFSNGVLQRIHYSVKKYLAEKKELEFMWRQLWSGSDGSADLTTHIMPFFSYDVPHTCGPDPKICCQFDFKRTVTGGLTCPWDVPAVDITDDNVAERASILYDQYRKKAQLFKTNIVLVPLGDDFRYDTKFEWKNQYSNYMKLFNFMNRQTKWNVNARFGTPNDYFNLVHERLREDGNKLPVLSGDFFTYADRNDHYWSGYYTSRPFYKRLDRVLQHYVRTAEILYSFMKINKLEGELSTSAELFGLLVKARRSMSLFQHHDGVTGTSKTHVMSDYGQKMFAAIKNCEQVILNATDCLLRKKMSEKPPAGPDFVLLMEENRKTFDVLPQKTVAATESELIVFNSLGSERSETICVHVNTVNAVVVLASEPSQEIPQQLGPVLDFIDDHWTFISDSYELCFFATLPPLSFRKYLIKRGTARTKAKIRTSASGLQNNDFDIAPLGNFVFDNGVISVKFDPTTGHLASVSLEGRKEVSLSASFVWYGARLKSPVPLKGSDNAPGAYLFLPDGPAKRLETKDTFVVVQGIVMKKVLIAKKGSLNFTHVVKVSHLSPSIEVENTIHLREVANTELAMRLKTDIDNGDEFFTDLNGYQLIKRRRFKQLPLQAHFYPMSGSAFIEDEGLRMTLLTAQPLGVANLISGQLEVMLDRRLNQDDERGLQSDVTDNMRTTSYFRLLLETRDQQAGVDAKTRITAYHSIQTYNRMLSLLYPPVVILADRDEGRANDYQPIRTVFPCDIHPVTLRTVAAPTIYSNNSTRIYVPQNSHALILHRFGIDCNLSNKLPKTCDTKLNITKLLVKEPSRATEMSLSMLYEYSGSSDGAVLMKPMEIRTFRLDFT